MSAPRYLALCGGVGGVKLALGLSHVLAPEQLSIVVNTADDFEHLGLFISPDIDTVTYTLAGLVHPAQGWGRDTESFAALDTVAMLGWESWFKLGDKDIGLHLVRRAMLSAGKTLSAVTAHIAGRLGVDHEIAPMSDDPVRTIIDTEHGPLPFQNYFVQARCTPVVTGLRYTGAAAARLSPPLARALADPNLAGVILCPSNPYLSIDPMLAIPGVREALQGIDAPVIAVAPLIAGEAIKGPTAKIMRELALEPSASAVARHYADILDGYLLDPRDVTSQIEARCHPCNVLMKTLPDKITLARECIAFATALRHA